MTYLVTGGAGFVGSHLAEALLRRGEQVVILDNFNDYYDPAVKHHNIERLQPLAEHLTVIEGDIRNNDLIGQIFDQHSVTHVAHMAAMAGVRLSMKQSALYMDVNVTGTLNLLEAASAHRIRQFVLASTSSVYGKTQTLPFVETDSADHPLASYPASKRAAEILAHTYYHLHGLNVTALRFFNVYGPAGRPDMMPMRLLNAAIEGAPVSIFGEGDLQRDWTYIEDTVEGVIAALHRPLGYEVINLGVGGPIPLLDFIDIVEELTGRTVQREYVAMPPSEPPITYCDNTKARQLLGFAPSIPVQEGMRRTWEWFRERHNL